MRILLVEDESRIIADVSATLEAAGYTVDIARNGEEAWFRGDTEDYDLVVLDLGLPGMDGLSVLKRWRDAGRFPLPAARAWTALVAAQVSAWRSSSRSSKPGAES